MSTRTEENLFVHQPTEAELREHYGYIYRITNTHTGASYVGEHKHTRGEEWRTYMGSSAHLDQEMKSYGSGSFIKEWLAWTESELQALLLEGRFITKQLALGGYCYNSSNSYAVHRDPQANTLHFAFRASFRPHARLTAIISELSALKEEADDLTEEVALHELRFAHELALKIKAERVRFTGVVDDKDLEAARS